MRKIFSKKKTIDSPVKLVNINNDTLALTDLWELITEDYMGEIRDIFLDQFGDITIAEYYLGGLKEKYSSEEISYVINQFFKDYIISHEKLIRNDNYLKINDYCLEDIITNINFRIVDTKISKAKFAEFFTLDKNEEKILARFRLTRNCRINYNYLLQWRTSYRNGGGAVFSSPAKASIKEVLQIKYLMGMIDIMLIELYYLKNFVLENIN